MKNNLRYSNRASDITNIVCSTRRSIPEEWLDTTTEVDSEVVPFGSSFSGHLDLKLGIKVFSRSLAMYWPRGLGAVSSTNKNYWLNHRDHYNNCVP